MRHNRNVPRHHHRASHHHPPMPLNALESGESGTVVQIIGGHGFVGRMVALGFTPGSTVDVVRNPGTGPIIVRVLDTQIALGPGQAARVKVRTPGH